MTARPQRIQLSRRKGWKMPPNTVKVDRSTKWGNPFVVGKHGTRPQCVDLFKALMGGLLCLSQNNLAEQVAYYQYVKRNHHRLRGKNLACWCPLPKPGEPDLCHAAVLLEIANR